MARGLLSSRHSCIRAGANVGDLDMETNKALQLNLGVINVPTIAAIVGLGLIVWNAGGEQRDMRGDIDALEKVVATIQLDRATAKTDVLRQFESLSIRVAKIDNVDYRIGQLEAQLPAGMADVNRRVDRFGDSMQDLRSDIGVLAQNFAVLAEQVRASLPKKADLDLGDLPEELGPVTR